MMISEKIKMLLAAKGMNVNDLAEKAELKVSTIYQWLRGKTQPRGRLLTKLAIGLEVSTDFLLGIIDYRTMDAKKIAAIESKAVFFRQYNIDESDATFHLYEQFVVMESPPVDLKGWKNLRENTIPTIAEYFNPKKSKTRTQKPSMTTPIATLNQSRKVLPIHGRPRRKLS